MTIEGTTDASKIFKPKPPAAPVIAEAICAVALVGGLALYGMGGTPWSGGEVGGSKDVKETNARSLFLGGILAQICILS